MKIARILAHFSLLLAAANCADGLSGEAALRVEPAAPKPPVGSNANTNDAGTIDDAGHVEEPEASIPSTPDPIDAAAVADASNDVTTPPPVLIPPVLDGDIVSGEYGVHANGQNQQAFDPNDATSTTWYLTWSETHFYVGVSAANVAEGVVLYIDHTPLTPSNSGTNADGSLAGNAYDNTKPSALPFRADFVAYFKAGYNEYRTANGANGWSAPTAGALTQQAAVGTKREIAIPWSVIKASGRPASFSWLGYATSPAGWVYGPMPRDLPPGNVGQNATFASFYKVTDATPVTGTKPFAVQLTP